jgi:hypothetical protein
MPAIVEFPTVVQDLLAQYADLFANKRDANPAAREWVAGEG